jgi:hypothetical protein
VRPLRARVIGPVSTNHDGAARSRLRLLLELGRPPSESRFIVLVTESPVMDAVKDQRGVPKTVRSCSHRRRRWLCDRGSRAGGRHQRLLKERPPSRWTRGTGMPAWITGNGSVERSGPALQRDRVRQDREDDCVRVPQIKASPRRHEGQRRSLKEKACLRVLRVFVAMH